MAEAQNPNGALKADSPIPAEEKQYLRELAKKQLEYARLPLMAERKRLWTLHNRLEGERPMIVVEDVLFLHEIMPPQRCTHPAAKKIESQLNYNIAFYKHIDDDKVVPDYFSVNLEIHGIFLEQHLKRSRAAEGLGYHIFPVFETVEEGLPLLRPTEYSYDREKTETNEKIALDTIGDILPVVRKNNFNHWFFVPTSHIVNFMTMENMYCSMITEPDNFHKLMEIITEDSIRCLRWQEKNNLIVPNSGNDFTASGSYGFSDELPGDISNGVTSKNIWGHINSQESVGISPDHFDEFIYPYYEKLANQFGLLYYGCCEPVHAYWDRSLSRLSNLRKLSISPWCDEDFMGERLAGSKVIYSRKPSPNYLGISRDFDEDSYRAHIKKSADAIKGRCKAEFILRDIYTLHGNLEKIRSAVKIIRNITENM